MCNHSPISRFRPGFIPLLSLFVCLLLLISIGPGSTQGLAAQVTLAWDANTDPAVAGYKLYYGTASRTYGTPVDVGKVTQYTLPGIQEGINSYFAVAAYDANRNESAFSTELECFTLSPAPGLNGAISPSSAVVVSRGMNQTFTVTPAANYSIADVLVDNVSIGAVTSYTFSNVTAAHSISATFSAKTYTITASAGANGTIGPLSASVSHNASQAFTITPNTGYQVKDVLVDNVSVGAVTSYTFSNVTAAHSLSATFIANTYAIAASAGTNGSISPSGSVSVSQGGSQAFTVTANTGYQVADVKVDGISVGAVTSYTFTTVTAARSIAASFVAKTYVISASAGTNGTISPLSASVAYNASQAFTITPNTGYQVKDVLVDNVSVGAVTSYTFSNVTAAHSFSATFIAKTYAIAASAGTNGTISPSGSVSVSQGGSQAFTITANTGYQVADVKVDGSSVGAVTSYAFTNVTAARSISVTFAAISKYTISASAGPGGIISPSGSVQVQKGASQGFSITPNTNYQVTNVLVNGTSVGAVTSYTFSNVQSNHSISATFKRNSKATSKTTLLPGEVSSSLLAGSGRLPGSGGWIEVLNFQGAEAALSVYIDWPEYNKLNGEMRVATGNIDGSGQDKIVVGLGPAPGSLGIPGGYFAVLDANYSVIAWGQVEWPEYNEINGETRPACGDIDGDGIDEIIIGLGPGGQGHMEVFKFVDNRLKHVKWLQTGWQDYNKGNGETRPACGDLDGDGKDEVIAGLGPVDGNPDIPGGVFFIFDQTSVGSVNLRDSSLSDASGRGQTSWPDYNRINGEIWPACGDVNGDGRDEIVLGLGKQGAGRFEILGFDLVKNLPQRIAWQQSLLSAGLDVRPACGRLKTDAAGDGIVFGFSKAGEGFVEVFGNAAQNFQSLGQVQTQFKDSQKQESQIWPAVFQLGTR